MATAPAPLRVEHLFGLDFVADASINDIVELLLEEPPRNGWNCVVTPNVDHLVRYERFAEEAEAARHSTLVLPDGMPIVWASRILGRRLAGRLTGADLFAALWPRLVEAGTPTVVVASSAKVAARMQASNQAVHCLVPPQFDVGDHEQLDSIADWVAERSRAYHARFVVIGVSMPKHHRIANRLRARLDGVDAPPTVLLLGASPDFALGLTPRAPSWMQRLGIEWVHRLLLDPRRLAKRYLIDDAAFLRLVLRERRRR
jgi:N-acetylglucosaminyldiphosphoundecaprenol N-acetyl-beta-D-mannosaminyltransferase